MCVRSPVTEARETTQVRPHRTRKQRDTDWRDISFATNASDKCMYKNYIQEVVESLTLSYLTLYLGKGNSFCTKPEYKSTFSLSTLALVQK